MKAKSPKAVKPSYKEPMRPKKANVTSEKKMMDGKMKAKKKK